MIKGFGIFAFVLFLLLCTQIGSFGPGFAIWFLSLILIVSGTIASALFLLPPAFEQKSFLPIQCYGWVNPSAMIETIHGICDLIRKEGLLSLESVRGTVKDHWLQYSLGKFMEGFDSGSILPVLRNEGQKSTVLFAAAESYLDRVLITVPLYGLAGSLAHLMEFLGKSDSLSIAASFVPFFLSILLQVSLSLWFQRKLDFLSAQARNYHLVLEDGVAGLGEGISADMLKDRLKARITHA